MRIRLVAAKLAAVALGAAALPIPMASAQAPNASFAVVGHIEAFTLDAGGGPMRSARMTVSNLDIRIPANLLITMPGRYMTADDLFHGPSASGGILPDSGIALKDPTPPRILFEAEIIGNIVGSEYVAGNVKLSQGALHTGAGVIQSIDPATGEMHIGAPGAATGARVILNDPNGVYGLANGEGAKAAIPLDARFAVDPDNAPVHAKTGFPVCVPAISAEARCPPSNRLSDIKRFTCTPPGGAPTADAPATPCDPTRPAPLRVGDYVTYFGVLQSHPDGGFRIAAYGLDAELGIYTSPGAEPVYVLLEEAIQGTKGEEFPGVPQEETTRFRIVGFTTDPSRNVEVKLIDSGRNEVGTSFSGPGGLTPSNGPQLGRVRNTWPSKDDARAVRRDAQLLVVGSPHATLPSGLTSGVYTAPVGEYIYPEPTTFGVDGRPTPVPFENFCFLATGGGSFDTVSGARPVARINPFPESGHPLSQPIGAGPARACDGQ